MYTRAARERQVDSSKCAANVGALQCGVRERNVYARAAVKHVSDAGAELSPDGVGETKVSLRKVAL